MNEWSDEEYWIKTNRYDIAFSVASKEDKMKEYRLRLIGRVVRREKSEAVGYGQRRGLYIRVS